MKPKHILIAVLFSAFIFWLRSTGATFDIQIYDTYYVIEYWLLITFLTLFLVCFGSLGIAIHSRFSKPFYNWTALVSGILFVACYMNVFFKIG